MGTDDLRQVGQTLNTANRQAQYAVKRDYVLHPKVERVRDSVTKANPFKMQFVVEENFNPQMAIKFDLISSPPTVGEIPIVGGTGITTDPPSGGGVTTISVEPVIGHFVPTQFAYVSGYIIISNPAIDQNFSSLTYEDLYYIYSPGYTVRQGNIYRITRDVTIKGIGFFSEPSTSFEITVGKVGAGGIANTEDLTYTTLQLALGQTNTYTSTYTGGTNYGWHIITGMNYTFSAGDWVAFLFKGTSLRPNPSGGYYQSIALHDQTVKYFPFAEYYGCNIYQVSTVNRAGETVETSIVSPSIGVNYDGQHGMIGTNTGDPVPQYGIMFITGDSVPSGAEQLDEVPLGINGQSYGDPAYIFNTLTYQTLFNFRPGTLKVWINGLQQIVQPLPGFGTVSNASIYEDKINQFKLMDDVPALEDWERITCSYVVY